MESLMDYLAVFGRFHPLLLHMPIGMLIGLGMMELAGWRRGAAPASAWFLIIATGSAVIAAASGWMLHEEDGYATSFALTWHERLGIATAFATLLCCTFRLRGSPKQYRLTLLLAILLLGPAGHFGAEMTHGKGFLFEPLEEDDAPDYVPLVLEPADAAETAGPSASGHAESASAADGESQTASYAQHVAPLLQARCTKCHGRRKSKGELRLDSPEHILAGGENGAVLGPEAPVAGGSASEEAEILRRLQLPLDHDDHMPPESKTQLTSAEMALLRLWLEAGAPFEQDFALGAGMASPQAPRAEVAQAEAAKDASTGPRDDPEHAQYLLDLDALRREQVYAEPVAPGSKQLEVSFVPVKGSADDAMVARLVMPLLDYVEELVLADTMITDRTLDLVAQMQKVLVVNLDQASITDQGLTALHGHPSLEQLVVSQTLVTSESTGLFQSLPRLTQLYLWGTGFLAEEVVVLRAQLPQVAIDFGDSFQAEPLEVEAALVFTSDAPLIDAPPDAPIGAAVSLVPVNQQCPVSDKPVDPRYSVVHDGKVLGFCCPNCPKTFWEDPSAYPVE